MDEKKRIVAGLLEALKRGLISGGKTTLLMLITAMVTGLGFVLTKNFPIFPRATAFLSPAFAWIGLSGQAALAFLASAFFNVYGALGVIVASNLEGRELAILAPLCLIIHNAIPEAVATKRAHSSVTKMFFLRFSTALFLAWSLHRLLPTEVLIKSGAGAPTDLISQLLAATYALIRFLIPAAIIIIAAEVLRRWLEVFSLMPLLAKIFLPLTRILGLPDATGQGWIVSTLFSYRKGLQLVSEEVKEARCKPQDSDLFNHHACLNHGILKDSSLFFLAGAPALWLVLPRVIIALAVVWLEKLRRHWFRKSFKVGTV